MKTICERGIGACVLVIIAAAIIQAHREALHFSPVAVLLLIAACVLTQRMGGGLRSAFTAVALSVCVLSSCRLLVNTHVPISEDRILYFRPTVLLLATICLLASFRPPSERASLKPSLWVHTVHFTALAVLLVALATFFILARHYLLESSLVIQIVLKSTAILVSFAIATAGFSEPRWEKRFDAVVVLGPAGMLVASLIGGHLP